MPNVIVLHGGYGCDTGCCGHWVEIDGERMGSFSFDHPDHFSHPTPEGIKEFIRALVTAEAGEEHVADINWDECIVSTE